MGERGPAPTGSTMWQYPVRGTRDHVVDGRQGFRGPIPPAGRTDHLGSSHESLVTVLREHRVTPVHRAARPVCRRPRVLPAAHPCGVM